jgi:glyceraldehyde 3-phosphate dehydrogenase
MPNIAINGLGRIGRLLLRALCDDPTLKVVAIHDNTHDTSLNAHLIQYDTVHGMFKKSVSATSHTLIIDQHVIPYYHHLTIWPWAQHDVDVVIDCTGQFTKRHHAEQHLQSGARYVLISAPGHDMDCTLIAGVNFSDFKKHHTLVSAGSCTTHALAPILSALSSLVLQSGHFVTVHAVTNDQSLVDRHHVDFRRARSALNAIIPTKTGAATTMGHVMPTVKNRLQGYALRVPVQNVSYVALTARFQHDVQHAMQWLQDFSLQHPTILHVSDQPLVSVDFCHTPFSSIIDSSLVQWVDQHTVHIPAWYDNEWAFCLRLVDTVRHMATVW